MSKRNPAHLALVRTYPCVALELPARKDVDLQCFGVTHAHHPIGAGMALKDDDTKTFPLCTKHHADFHDLRGLFRDFTNERIHEWETAMSARFCPTEEILDP